MAAGATGTNTGTTTTPPPEEQSTYQPGTGGAETTQQNLAGAAPITTQTAPTVNPTTGAITPYQPILSTPQAQGLLSQVQPVTAPQQRTTDTVAEQVSQLTQQDDPYMQRAAYKGQDVAARRGLLNSSLAAQAAQAAAIEAAFPMVQQQQQADLTREQFEQQRGLQQQELQFRGASQLAQQFEAEAARLQQAGLFQQELEQKRQLFNADLANKMLVQTTASGTTFMEGYAAKVLETLGDTKLGQTNKEIFLERAREILDSSLNVIGSIGQIDLTSYLGEMKALWDK